MNRLFVGYFAVFCLLAGTSAAAAAAGRYFEVNYPPSTEPGELRGGVTYTLWVPDGVAELRGIIVHQHGCGAGACKGGILIARRGPGRSTSTA